MLENLTDLFGSNAISEQRYERFFTESGSKIEAHHSRVTLGYKFFRAALTNRADDDMWVCARRLQKRYGAMKALVRVNNKLIAAAKLPDNIQTALWFALAYRLAHLADTRSVLES